MPDLYRPAPDGTWQVHVRATPCAHCLLSRDRLVDGPTKRSIIERTRAEEGSTFPCHRSQVSDEEPSICRAWFDAFGAEDWILRWAVNLDIVVFDSYTE